MELQTTLVIIGLLFAHFIADFVCQTHWMATNKSKDWHALRCHVLTYAGIMGAVVVIYRGFTLAAADFTAITFATHFVTDAITSRITAKLWATKRVHDFFVIVGFDQWIHATTLILTARWLGLLH